MTRQTVNLIPELKTDFVIATYEKPAKKTGALRYSRLSGFAVGNQRGNHVDDNLYSAFQESCVCSFALSAA